MTWLPCPRRCPQGGSLGRENGTSFTRGVVAEAASRPAARRRMARAGLLALAGGILGGAARPSRGQTPGGAVAPPPQPLVIGALTDTTALSGRQDFTSYTTPGLCLAAVRATETIAHRAADDSTAFYYHPEDTLSTAAVTIARRCATHFTVAATAPAELMDLAQLALAVGDEAKAHAATERYIAVAPDLEARRWALFAVDTLYFHAKPRRWAVVEGVTARLDSLGAAAILQRKRAHDELYMDAMKRYDVPRLRRELVALFGVCAQLSGADLEQSGCTPSMLALDLFLVELYQSPGEVSAALERVGKLLRPLGFKDWAGFTRALYHEQLTAVPLGQLATVAPPLPAQHWVGSPGRVPGWPVKGKASVFLRGTLSTDELQKMAVWRRLGEKYKDALDITILLPTQGYFRDGPPLSPAEEAQRLGKYYQEQLGVPATVAVVETPMQQLPPPDGRFLLGEPPLRKDPYYGQGAFLLTDRAGKILLSRVFGRGASEAMLDAWIARALGR